MHQLITRARAQADDCTRTERARDLTRLATASTRADNWLLGLALLLALAGICQ